jgi:hypothetical protein
MSGLLIASAVTALSAIVITLLLALLLRRLLWAPLWLLALWLNPLLLLLLLWPCRCPCRSALVIRRCCLPLLLRLFGLNWLRSRCISANLFPRTRRRRLLNGRFRTYKWLVVVILKKVNIKSIFRLHYLVDRIAGYRRWRWRL